MARIAIIGAMKEEIENFITSYEIKKKIEWSSFVFYELTHNSHEVIIVKSGAGKVLAAMITQKLIDIFSPDMILFTGVAGALNAALDIGDIVISRDCIQHDLDVTALGFVRGTAGHSNHREFIADRKLLKIALSAKVEGHKIYAGRILTGDQFLTRKHIESQAYLIKELAGDAIEMEGSAVGQVCILNNLPFLIVRTISDKADGSAPDDFGKFTPLAAKNSFLIVEHILKNIPK